MTTGMSWRDALRKVRHRRAWDRDLTILIDARFIDDKKRQETGRGHESDDSDRPKKKAPAKAKAKAKGKSNGKR